MHTRKHFTCLRSTWTSSAKKARRWTKDNVVCGVSEQQRDRQKQTIANITQRRLQEIVASVRDKNSCARSKLCCTCSRPPNDRQYRYRSHTLTGRRLPAVHSCKTILHSLRTTIHIQLHTTATLPDISTLGTTLVAQRKAARNRNFSA